MNVIDLSMLVIGLSTPVISLFMFVIGLSMFVIGLLNLLVANAIVHRVERKRFLGTDGGVRCEEQSCSHD